MQHSNSTLNSDEGKYLSPILGHLAGLPSLEAPDSCLQRPLEPCRTEKILCEATHDDLLNAQNPAYMRMFQDVVVLRNQVDSLQKAYNDLLAIVAQTQTHSFGDCDHGFAIKRHDRERATKRRAPSPEYPIVKKARTHSPPLFFHAPISSISSSFAEEYRLASLSAHNAEQYPTKVEPHPIPVPVHTKPVAVPFSVRDTNILESAAPISRKNPQTLSIQASRPIKSTGSLASTVRFDPAASAPSKRRIRMRASNSTTARNLYAKDYLKEHPDTTAQEFAEVWHVLDERIRSKYVAASLQMKVEARDKAKAQS